MFHEGDLQSGIALALAEAKQVICFVRDESEESSRWEDEYLKNEEISALVASKAISLKLQAGSVEAGFLASFCPINKVPTLVVIKNGVLRGYIVSGVAEEEFKRRLKTALEDPQATTTPSPAPAPTAQTAQTTQMDSSPTPQQTTPASSLPAQSHAPENTSGSREDVTAAERERRESIRAGKRRAETVEEPDQAQASPKRDPQKEYRLEQRKREQQQKEERQRVLDQIRRDNEARKAREQETRKASQAASQTASSENSTPKAASPPQPASNQVRLQIRLFDGASVRSTFSPRQTIRGDVRPWLDSQRSDGDAPYNLKLILAPSNNRVISVSEEDQGLEDIELGPTANLVMVPVRTYTEAYAPSVASLPVRGLYAGYDLASGIVGAAAGALGSFLGIGQNPAAVGRTPQPAPEPAPETPRGTVLGGRNNGRSNIRTLYDDDGGDKKPQQFYNGNQLRTPQGRRQG
ncbi:hypothetical protein FQN50_004905 [Emmonsiellopsis sp. PD_5]|nr:hypothetical protein FQN50_004905 [Emmonsiellopsis sp. PD_5]